MPVLRGASFVIGGRYHAAISALSQGTPVVLLPAQTFKSAGIGPMLGLDLPVFDVRDATGILEYISQMLSQRDLRRKIAVSVANLSQTYDAFGAYMREIIRASGEGRNLEPPALLTPPIEHRVPYDRHWEFYTQVHSRDRTPTLSLLRALWARLRTKSIEQTFN